MTSSDEDVDFHKLAQPMCEMQVKTLHVLIVCFPLFQSWYMGS